MRWDGKTRKRPGRAPRHLAALPPLRIFATLWLGAALLCSCPSRSYSAPLHLSLSSEHFRVRYPARTEQREIETVLGILETVYADLQRRLTAASLRPARPTLLDVILHATTQDFVTATGQPWWVAAVTLNSRIELQPLRVLRRRGVLTTTLRHEYTHTVIESIGRGSTPRWLAEGLAIHIAGEGAMFARFEPAPRLMRDEVDRGLAHPASAQQMRALYAAAYREVRMLIRVEGEAGVWRRVAQYGLGRSVPHAKQEAPEKSP